MGRFLLFHFLLFFIFAIYIKHGVVMPNFSLSKCSANEELSPHHHSEAVRIGFLRIKRTVIWRTGQFSCIVTVYRGEQAEVLQLLPISHAKLTTALENGAGTR
jgi:hypothetical protein